MNKDRLNNLKAFCQSERQTELLEAVIESGSIAKAAKAIGVHPANIKRAIKRVERYAALQGFSPDHDMTKVCPDSHYVKGTSTLYGEDGKAKLQWVKTNAKLQDMMQDLRDFAEALGDETKGGFKRAPNPKATAADMLTVYPLADLHVGMLSWSRETRDDYDIQIARRLIDAAADAAVSMSPASKEAVVANLGDFFHFDSDNKQTTSGNILDVDGRWYKVVEIGVAALLRFIRLALEKHNRVTVYNSIGNHDGRTALVLPLILKPYFRDEPRVIIDDTPRLHHYHRFGANLLGFHHGHGTRPEQLPGVMVADMLLNQDEDTDGVEFCHWLLGHIHHKDAKEYNGILVESFRTLAAKDAWHAGAGYRALRDIQTITYHRTFGEVSRVRISHKLLKGSL